MTFRDSVEVVNIELESGKAVDIHGTGAKLPRSHLYFAGDAMSESSGHGSFSYSEFTPVKPRKKRRNKTPGDVQSPMVVLQRVREELGRGDWLTQCQQILESSLNATMVTSPDVLCLGLGSPTSSPNARIQLAFLLEMCDRLNVDRANVSIYDPVFTAEDVSLFGNLQIRLLTENKNAGYALQSGTICFMPHCDMELYENIIKANWSREKLSNLVLIANCLTDYIDSNPRHKLESRAPSLMKLAPLLHCCPLPASSSWPTAFNNTSVQFVGEQADTWFPSLGNGAEVIQKSF